MANQALINAAQRMYSAKAQQTDITPITDAISSSVANITKAVQEKKAEQEENSKKPFKSFKKILLENPEARPQMQQELDKLQEEFYQNIKKSEKLFGNKQEKQDAINANNDISVALAAWEKDLASIDEKMLIPSNPSKFNSLPEQVNNVASKDGKNLSGRLIFKSGKDAGVYTKDAFGKEVRLSEFGGVSEVNTEGFLELNKLNDNVVALGNKGASWEGQVKRSLTTRLNVLMQDKNWGSILFDELDGYSWATQQMEQEKKEGKKGVEDIEAFKLKVKADPEYYKQEYVNDIVAAYKINFDEGLRIYQEIKDEDSEKSIKDIDLAVENINDGLPIVLSSITGDSEDRYVNIIPDPEDKNKYVYAKKGGQILEGYPKLSTQDLAKLLNVPLIRLTGSNNEKKDPLNPFN